MVSYKKLWLDSQNKIQQLEDGLMEIKRDQHAEKHKTTIAFIKSLSTPQIRIVFEYLYKNTNNSEVGLNSEIRNYIERCKSGEDEREEIIGFIEIVSLYIDEANYIYGLIKDLQMHPSKLQKRGEIKWV